MNEEKKDAHCVLKPAANGRDVFPQTAGPLVSCIMPTRNRERFVRQSIGYFLRQNYPRKELIVVDDGDQSVEQLIPPRSSIRYIRLAEKCSIGRKRNIAVRQSRGQIIAHWDDDDWYGIDRICRQLQTLVNEKAGICGIKGALVYDVQQDQFWAMSKELHSDMFFADVHGRSLMYTREVWTQAGPYPDCALGEDAQFLKRALKIGAGVARLEDCGQLIYIRHRKNTWRFDCGVFLNPEGWQAVVSPSFLPVDDKDFYKFYYRRRRSPIQSSPLRNISMDRAVSEPYVDNHVTVSIPYYACAAGLRRAVESILQQTHRNLTVVVVNDGDATPWHLLEDISDPRLVQFDLPKNQGRYFADAVVLNATQSAYFLVQDADDWSEPDRIERLLYRLRSDHAVGAVSAERVHHENINAPGVVERYPELTAAVGKVFKHRGNHHGLFKTSALRTIGGYFGGLRIGYDTLLINLLRMIGSLAYEERPLYHRMMRSASLSNSSATGMRSPKRVAALKQLSAMYSQAFAIYQQYLKGREDYARLCAGICTICHSQISPESEKLLDIEAERLRRRLDRIRIFVERSPGPLLSVADAVVSVDDPRLPWTDWSIDKNFARCMMSSLEAEPPRRILEVGSGVSTVLLADFAARSGAELVSLEHDPEFYQQTKQVLTNYGLEHSVDLRLAPLADIVGQDGTPYPWYTTQFTSPFDFVLIDGPPERFGRKAAMFALIPHLAKGWSVWLHDAYRPHEQECIALWSRHARFVYTLYRAEQKGVFCLSDPSGAAFLPYEDSKKPIGIALLTGDRPRLLSQTLASLQTHMEEVLFDSQMVVLLNGRDPESERLLQASPYIDHILYYKNGILPIGTAAGYLAGSFCRLRGVQYILHLEDDWLMVATDEDWLQRAEDILSAYPEVGQVRLRRQSESVLKRHMISKAPIYWQQHAGYLLSNAAHFTFNPNLMRVADVLRIYPSESEAEAQKKFLCTGFHSAQLLPGCFRHIGARQSRRVGLSRGPIV